CHRVLSGLLRPPGASNHGGMTATRRYAPPSYLNEPFTLARYADTWPFSSVTSSSETSAMRRSRSDCDASATAAATACSHPSVLVPTSSMTLYALSAMSPPICAHGCVPPPNDSGRGPVRQGLALVCDAWARAPL